MVDDVQDQGGAARIRAARDELARRYTADPEAARRFEARKAKLAAAAKRERERFDQLVLGKPRPKPPTGGSPAVRH